MQIWIEMYERAASGEVEMCEEVLKSWFVLGRLGGFNTMNLQVPHPPPSPAPCLSAAALSPLSQPRTDAPRQTIALDKRHDISKGHIFFQVSFRHMRCTRMCFAADIAICCQHQSILNRGIGASPAAPCVQIWPFRS